MVKYKEHELVQRDPFEFSEQLSFSLTQHIFTYQLKYFKKLFNHLVKLLCQ